MKSPAACIRCLGLLLGLTAASFAQAPSPAVTNRDVAYGDDHPSQCLDVYLAKSDHPTPAMIYIHGCGWRGGSYKSCPVAWLAEHGFAVASISYRLTDVATFPAQIYDCKGAVRWL